MDKIFNWTSTVIGIVGGFFAAIFGQWDSILWALLVIMVLDYLTGIIKAIYTKTMSSEIGILSLIHISEPRDRTRSRMPSSA